jgi:hypothetical protein
MIATCGLRLCLPPVPCKMRRQLDAIGSWPLVVAARDWRVVDDGQRAQEELRLKGEGLVKDFYT